MTRRVVYPGSFNPPTIAHLALAEAALTAGHDLIEFVISRRALGKDTVERPTLDERIEVIRASLVDLPGATVRVTEARLLSDIAAGADAIVMGMDKWRQIHEPQWYPDLAGRDAAIRSLPSVLLVRRGDDPPPPSVPDGPSVRRLDVADELVDRVSSTAARRGAIHLMTPAAAVFARSHAVWGVGAGS